MGIGVLAVAGVVVYLVFGPKKGSTGDTVAVSGSPVAGFQFQEAKASAVSTSQHTDQKKANTAIRPVATQVTQQLNTLYGQAFVNPANWQKGTYDPALVVFEPTGGAQAEAQQQLDALTAGASAGSTYSSITDPRGTLAIKVLIDNLLKPDSAVGIVQFTATANGKDGSSTTIQSMGQYIFRNVGGTWKIVSFNVKRNDQPTSTPVTGSGSATPS